MKTKINLFLDISSSVSSKHTSQTKTLNLKNVLGNCIPSPPPKCCFFNLQLCLIFSFPLYHRITSLKDTNTLTHLDFPRSCGISTKCHDASKVMRASRTDSQWSSLKLPFPSTLNSLSMQRINQGYCRSSYTSLLLIGAMLYRGAVGEQCSWEVFLGLPNSLWCCSAVRALNSGFLGHMCKRISASFETTYISGTSDP